MRILIHQCCAPCSVYPVEKLMTAGVEIHGLFYNPNIHPYTEYIKRLNALIGFNDVTGIRYTVVDNYGLRTFIDMERDSLDRCSGCYRMRIEYTAQYAMENGFDAFTTTLLYSRRQKHDIIREIAEEVSFKHGVDFFYEDYRKGWQVGIDVSKDMGLYRQQYCGCIFSEEERYNKIFDML